jgi:hypothetical protein
MPPVYRPALDLPRLPDAGGTRRSIGQAGRAGSGNRPDTDVGRLYNFKIEVSAMSKGHSASEAKMTPASVGRLYTFWRGQSVQLYGCSAFAPFAAYE